MTKKPKAYMPIGVNLLRVSTYAKRKGISTVRVYQMFQEEKIMLVKIDGAIFVKL